MKDKHQEVDLNEAVRNIMRIEKELEKI